MILAIDTAQMTYSIALSNGFYQCWDDINISIHHQLSAIDCSEISKLIINIGPGRFSGIRSGLAFAKAFAKAKNIPLYTASQFEVIHHQTPSDTHTIAIDARRNQAYVQDFQNNQAGEIRLVNIEDIPISTLTQTHQFNARDLLALTAEKQPSDINTINAIYLRGVTD